MRLPNRWFALGLAVLACMATLLGPASGWGQAQSGPIVTIAQVLTDQFPQVVAYVSVLDGSGLAVPGLTESAFVVQEDGQAVSPFTVSPAREEGIRVVLALDASGSMRGGDALAHAQAAANTFLSRLTDKDQAALVVFSEQADLVVDFTSDVAALEAAVDAVEAAPQARTALYEAVFEAAERIGLLPPGRKALVVLTDGTDTVGGFSLKDAIEKAQEASAPVYTIGLLGGEFDPAPMRQLAESTRGLYLEAPSPDVLTERFQAVRELLEGQYVVRYASALRPENRRHELLVGAKVGEASAQDRHSFLPLPLSPWVQFANPLDGDAVAGPVDVAVEVAAREPVAQVALLVDGAEVARLTGPPYRHSWDSGTVPAGSHTLAAQAADVQGRTGSAQVQVDVRPVLAVALKAPADGSDVVGVVDVQPDVQAARKVQQVLVTVDGAPVATVPAPPYTFQWDTAPLAPGPHTLGVSVEDEKGTQAQAEARVNVQPVLTAAWVAPHPTDELTETVSLRVQAQGHYGVERVEFYANDELLGAVKNPPYELAWPTLSLEEGLYRLRACAYDVLGHEKCADLALELKRPGAGVALYISLGLLAVVVLGVTAMVVRSRQSARPARRPAARAPQPEPTPSAPARPAVGDERETRVAQPTVGPSARLVIQPKEGGPAREVVLGPGGSSIGRAEGNDVRLDDDLASRHHAAVEYDEGLGGFVFRDLNPTNPSIINGQEYAAPHLLRPGDTILVGDTRLVFEEGAE